MNNIINQEEKDRIDALCKEYHINNYSINGDGTIDVMGGVNLFDMGLSKLPVKFRKVSGNFDCSNNRLTSFEDYPVEVGGAIWIEEHNLPNEFLIAFYDFPSSLVLDYDDDGESGERLIFLQIFLKYHSYYDVWSPEFSKENMQLLVDDIKDGLR